MEKRSKATKNTKKKNGTTRAPAPELCEVVVILDRSGSMSSIKTDMEGGFNAFVAKQQQLPGECRLTLVQFDSQGIDTIHKSLPIAQVPPLVLEPRGNTPLLDAVGHTVSHTEKRLHGTADRIDPKRVMVLIITDGQENASHEFTREVVKKLVERVTKEHQWSFVYLGADVDAFAEAQGLGIGTVSTSSYAKTATGARNAFAMTSNKLAGLRATGQSVTFSNADRTAMGGDPLDEDDTKTLQNPQ